MARLVTTEEKVQGWPRDLMLAHLRQYLQWHERRETFALILCCRKVSSNHTEVIMQTHLKTLFVALSLTGLLVTTLSACSHHHGRSSHHRSASYGGFYGQAHPYGEPYDEHHDERGRDRHDGDYHGHGY